MIEEPGKRDTSFVSAIYNRVYRNYDVSRHAGTTDTQLFIELLSPLENSSVLEVGCGTGNYLLQLKDLAGHIVGLDLSRGMLSRTREKAGGAVLVCANAQILPFPDNSFDAAYCVQVLHHIPDKERAISEIYRVLRPGGRFAVQSCSHAQLATFCFSYYFPRGLEVDMARIPDCSDICGLFSAAGFQSVGVSICPLENSFRDAPEDYLDETIRDGSSTFSFLTEQEIEQGCERIRRDVSSGRSARVVAELWREAEKTGRVSIIHGTK